MGCELSGTGNHLFCTTSWVPATGGDDCHHGYDLGIAAGILFIFQNHPAARRFAVCGLAPKVGRKAKWFYARLFLFSSLAKSIFALPVAFNTFFNLKCCIASFNITRDGPSGIVSNFRQNPYHSIYHFTTLASCYKLKIVN